MAHRKLDRVQQTTTWNGAGGLAFDGPVPPRMRTFADTMSNGDQCWVLIEHQTAAEWEISLATYNTGAITRSFATGSSSSTGSLVSFSAGLKTVSLIAPAGATPITDGSGNMSVPGSVTAGGLIQVYNTAPEMRVARSDDGQGWVLFNHSAGSNNLVAGYLTGGALAGSVVTLTRTGRLGVGVTPASIGHFRLTQNGNTDVTVDNMSAGGGASARLILGTGTANSYASFGLMDNAGFPYVEFAAGPGVIQMIHSVQAGGFHEFYGGRVRPSPDNTNSLGDAARRWSVLFAGTGTINTSDRAEKQDFRAFSAAERRVAKALVELVQIYRWKSAVAEKGDAARWHSGWIAQDVIAAFEAEELDPFKYACVGFDLVTKQEAFTEQRTREKKRDVEFVERVVEIIDGQPVEVERTTTRSEPVGVMMPVVDEQGRAVVVHLPPYADEEGNQVTPAPVPRLHFVPTMETYTHAGEREVPDIDPETNEQRKRYNIRPDQIAAFIFAGLGDRITTLETP